MADLMLTEHEPPKEPARSKAERRWKNNQAIKKLKEKQQKPQIVDPNAKPEIGDVVANVGKVDERVRKFERKFAKEIRQMMEGYALKNLHFYAAAIEHRRMILLREKLRRAKLAQQQREASK